MRSLLPPALSVVLLGCAGGVWEDACGCVPAWVGFASELGNPEPWSPQMVEPRAVSTTVWKYLNKQARPATVDAIRSMNSTFHGACFEDGAVISCTVWLWEREGEERGLRVEIRKDDRATHLAPSDVTTEPVTRDR